MEFKAFLECAKHTSWCASLFEFDLIPEHMQVNGLGALGAEVSKNVALAGVDTMKASSMMHCYNTVCVMYLMPGVASITLHDTAYTQVQKPKEDPCVDHDTPCYILEQAFYMPLSDLSFTLIVMIQ